MSDAYPARANKEFEFEVFCAAGAGADLATPVLDLDSITVSSAPGIPTAVAESAPAPTGNTNPGGARATSVPVAATIPAADGLGQSDGGGGNGGSAGTPHGPGGSRTLGTGRAALLTAGVGVRSREKGAAGRDCDDDCCAKMTRVSVSSRTRCSRACTWGLGSSVDQRTLSS